MIRYLLLLFFAVLFGSQSRGQLKADLLSSLVSPVLFRENDKTAYRDPAVLYHKSKFYLFFTLVRTEDSDKVFSYTVMSTSKNLKEWSPIKILTPRNQNLDYCSPGNYFFVK